MKTMLKMLAMSAIMVSGLAVAGGPTLYGKIHTSVDVMNNGGSSTNNTKYNETAVSSNASRIGVKGSEDIGNGMKVGYLIEWEVSMTGNSEDMGIRNRAVTLSGDWGTALVGKWDTPFKTLGRKVELFEDQIGDNRNMTAVNATGKYTLNTNGSIIDERWDNVIQYVTPDINGFKGAVAYSTDTNTDGVNNGAKNTSDNQDNDGYSATVTYERNSYMLGLGYVSKDSNGLGSNADDQKAWRLAGSYMPTSDIDVVASYTNIDNAGFAKNLDMDVITVGASYKMGNNKLKLQYAMRDVDKFYGNKFYGNKFYGNNDLDADTITVGLDHNFSRRTTMYVAYSMTDNDSLSGTTPWNVDHNTSAVGSVGDDADAFSLGIIHKF